MTATATVAGLARIPLEELHESPWNPRKHFDPKAIEERMDSLLATGQFTPILVRPFKAGGYEIGAGHIRYHAATLACERHPEGAHHRGLEALDAIVRDMDDATFIELLNVENLQRDDLEDLDEAEGFRNLMVRCRYDVKKIAARIGKSDRYVYDSLTLLKLIPQARVLFLEGKFERGHAIELARLSEEWQKKALDRGFNRYQQDRAGLWETEDFDTDATVPGQERLKPEEKVKPVSVREFKTWVDNNVRATPTMVDPFLFPDSAQLLAKAQAAKGRAAELVHITYDYRVPDAARDPKIKTYGAEAWKRADGQFKSKTCDHAVVGFVAAGPGRHEAFLVCVSKEQCAVHWRDWQKERERRAKALRTTRRPSTSGRAKVDDAFRARVAGEVVAAQLPAIVKAVKAIAAEIKVPDEIAWNLAHAQIEWGRWAKVGGRPGWSNEYLQDLGQETLKRIVPELPGKWGNDLESFKDVTAARARLALDIWYAQGGGESLSPGAIDEEVERRWKAELKTRTKAVEKHPPTSATPKAKGKKR